jgi:hypothetical protein
MTHLNQLRSELAFFNASASGKEETTDANFKDAENLIYTGLSSGSLTGMKEALDATVAKNKINATYMVNNARRNVWSLFGVEDKYQDVTDKNTQTTPASTIVGRRQAGK